MLHPYQDNPLFNQWNKDDFTRLLPLLQEERFETGTCLMRKGDRNSRLYWIVSGSVRIYIEQEVRVELALLAKGQFFGEMSCLTGDLASAYVEAVEPLHVLSISRDGMLMLMDQNPDFRRHMVEAMVKRIQSSNERVLEEHTKSFVIMKQLESEEQERYGELIGDSAAMRQLLSRIQRLAREQRHVVMIGERGSGKMSVARKLHYETTNGRYPLLVLHADERSQWDTQVKAARDGTVVVEDAESCWTDALALLHTSPQTRIVLLSTKPLTTEQAALVYIPPLRERMEDIPLLVHAYLEKEFGGSAEDMIAPDAMRMLSLYPYLNGNVAELFQLVYDAYARSEGRMIRSHHLRFGRKRQPGERPTIGLALGSGAARGMAHLGVLRTLEEEKIPIDLVTGTSVGSLVGGAFAAGMPVQDCIGLLRTLRWKQLVRFTLPKRSLVHNEPMLRFVENHVGKQLIEQLPIPFGAVASDVVTGEAHILRSGSLAHAICASTAVPVVMRPVSYQGKQLVDGAVVHPVPAALARSMGADIVIAVNVCPESFARGAARHLIDSLLNTIDMMSAKLVKEELQLADVVLRPELGFNQISFKDADNYVAAGEKVTREAIAHIRSKMALS